MAEGPDDLGALLPGARDPANGNEDEKSCSFRGHEHQTCPPTAIPGSRSKNESVGVTRSRRAGILQHRHRASPIRIETHSLSSNAPESPQSTTPQPGSPPDKATSELALFIAERLDHLQADDIKILDVSGPLVIADYFVIATVKSTRQAQSLAKDLEMAHKAQRGRRRRNGGTDAPDSNWVLIDFGDIVVHLFLPEARDYYGLETLWVDVPRLSFTPTAPRDADAASGEIRQPTLDGFGAFQPLAPDEQEPADAQDGDQASDDDDLPGDDLPGDDLPGDDLPK